MTGATPQGAADTSSPFGAGEAAFAGPSGMGAVDPGYIDSAIIRTQLRLRYDSAYHDDRPDRAEFFYAKCGCFRTAPVGQGFDPKAPGPPLSEGRIDYQEASAYAEVAWKGRVSGFIEMPWRFLNPEFNADTNGVGDIDAGFKAALICAEDYYLTFQFRTFAPTGDAIRGLGTDHVSLEPALLFQGQMTERLVTFAEVRDWIPIDGTDFAGNVIRYGIGVGYSVYKTECWNITPILEGVGWTVLGGKELGFPGGIKNAEGETIVNVKAGVRVNWGAHNSVYAGYGRSLTGDVWYKDIVRVEYRLAF
jgi:hypothetical protein